MGGEQQTDGRGSGDMIRNSTLRTGVVARVLLTLNGYLVQSPLSRMSSRTMTQISLSTPGVSMRTGYLRRESI
jgi:hypothetical protein